MDADALVRMLAEPTRLKVFSALVLGANTAAEAAEAAGVGVRAAAVALRRLSAAGLVELSGDRVAPRPEVLRRSGGLPPEGRELARQVRRPSAEDHGYVDRTMARVVGTFVRENRLRGLPAQRGRRRLVLEHVVQCFEPGVDYPEREVNVVLREWAGGGVDHVSLRRYLVDEELLCREDGIYRRCNGPVDLSKGT
ncbi:MAG TPA: DUF2087 domain-containing protein [Amycolatopsis sp.]|uniref:DUF2087 domain-containing protein n=1 Tax=Amycolatopsis sp. TaxID=37632 RepID=UPI002B45D382|nr:DUF2087 domain-containing protein [Amycolatopsis sp.]HKS45175.1 DUF2087 domain-containing protein [Amycolatopsis sp.]